MLFRSREQFPSLGSQVLAEGAQTPELPEEHPGAELLGESPATEPPGASSQSIFAVLEPQQLFSFRTNANSDPYELMTPETHVDNTSKEDETQEVYKMQLDATRIAELEDLGDSNLSAYKYIHTYIHTCIYTHMCAYYMCIYTDMFPPVSYLCLLT